MCAGLCQADYFTMFVGSFPKELDMEKLFEGWGFGV